MPSPQRLSPPNVCDDSEFQSCAPAFAQCCAPGSCHRAQVGSGPCLWSLSLCVRRAGRGGSCRGQGLVALLVCVWADRISLHAGPWRSLVQHGHEKSVTRSVALPMGWAAKQSNQIRLSSPLRLILASPAACRHSPSRAMGSHGTGTSTGGDASFGGPPVRFADLVRDIDAKSLEARAAPGTPPRKRPRYDVYWGNAVFVERHGHLVSPSVHLPVWPREDMDVAQRHPELHVAMVDSELLRAARALLAPGHSVGVLCLADPKARGGGYQDGQSGFPAPEGPEEELCRRLVTLFPALERVWYPLEEPVVTTNLWERRTAGDYQWMAVPAGPFTVVSAALPEAPKARDPADSDWLPDYRNMVGFIEQVESAVSNVLRRFASMGCSRIVLAAWGRGCPDIGNERGTTAVAQAFAECLESSLGRCFDMVLFAFDRSKPAEDRAYHIFARELEDIWNIEPSKPVAPDGGRNRHHAPFTFEG